MSAQATLDALDEAGRLLAPILQAETRKGYSTPSIWITPNGQFAVGDHAERYDHFVAGYGDTLSAAVAQFLANRSDKLAELERDEQLKREFEAFKAQQVAA